MVCSVANVVRFQFSLRAVNQLNRSRNAINQNSFRNYSSILINAQRSAKKRALDNVSINQRFVSIFKVNDHIKLFTEQPRQIEKDDKNLRLIQDSDGRPLLVILSYLLAKDKHLAKYAEFYFNHGFDVLVTRNTPWQTMWPLKSKVVAKDILKFLSNNNYYEKLVLHGFSVGGFLWAECLKEIEKNPDQYNPLVKRIKGQVWDSIIYFVEIPIGFSKACIPNNQYLQNKLKRYIEYHLMFFNESVSKPFRGAHAIFRENVVKTPAIFFVSKVDPIGTVSSNLSIKNSWEDAGVKVTWKVFEDSPHVCHFVQYREEYTALLESYLKTIDISKVIEEEICDTELQEKPNFVLS